MFVLGGVDIPDPPPQDSLLQLVSLQKASGCWALDSHLAAALGKTINELEKAKPEATSSNKVPYKEYTHMTITNMEIIKKNEMKLG